MSSTSSLLVFTLILTTAYLSYGQDPTTPVPTPEPSPTPPQQRSCTKEDITMCADRHIQNGTLPELKEILINVTDIQLSNMCTNYNAFRECLKVTCNNTNPDVGLRKSTNKGRLEVVCENQSKFLQYMDCFRDSDVSEKRQACLAERGILRPPMRPPMNMTTTTPVPATASPSPNPLSGNATTTTTTTPAPTEGPEPPKDECEALQGKMDCSLKAMDKCEEDARQFVQQLFEAEIETECSSSGFDYLGLEPLWFWVIVGCVGGVLVILLVISIVCCCSKVAAKKRQDKYRRDAEMPMSGGAAGQRNDY